MACWYCFLSCWFFTWLWVVSSCPCTDHYSAEDWRECSAVLEYAALSSLNTLFCTLQPPWSPWLPSSFPQLGDHIGSTEILLSWVATWELPLCSEQGQLNSSSCLFPFFLGITDFFAWCPKKCFVKFCPVF